MEFCGERLADLGQAIAVVAGPIAMATGLLLAIFAAGASTVLLQFKSRLDAVVAFGVVASAGVATVVLVSGLAGLLRPSVVVALAAGWAVAAGLAARRRSRNAQAIGWSAELAVARHRPWAALLVALAGVALAWQAMVALILPPFAFDGLTYHLTTAATWVQRGNVAPTPLSLCCAYYAATPELLIVVPALLQGSDSLVGAVQIPFVILGAAATAGIARAVGLSRSASAAAGALFAVTPAVLAQAPTNYVDVMLAAWVLAALHAVTRYAQTGEARQLLLAGMAAGLVFGTKGIGLIWAVMLFVTAAGAAIVAVRRGHAQARSAGLALGAAAAAGVALGSWWFVRNAAMTGNPLYPFAVRLLNWTIFAGPIEVDETLTVPPAGVGASWLVAVARSWASDLDFWNQGTYDYQQRLGGLGPLWAWLGTPLLAAMIAVLVRRRSVALLPVAAVLLVFVVQPYAWWARFTLPFAAIGAIAIALAASESPWRWARAGVQISAIGLALAGVVLSTHAVDPAAGAEKLPASQVIGLIGTPREKRSIGRLFHREYAFLEWVPDDATVVIDLHAEPVRFVSPLFGPRFTRQVLPYDGGQVPGNAWIVTSEGRPLDRLAHSTHQLVSDVRGVRGWRPSETHDDRRRSSPR